MNTKVQAHKEICEYLNNLYERKNHDYGDSFHQSFVEEGMAMPRIRLGDKFSRFKTLTLNGDQQVQDESVRDTLLDLANYAIMTVMEMDRAKKQDAFIQDSVIAFDSASCSKTTDEYRRLIFSDESVKKAAKLARARDISFETEEDAKAIITHINSIITKSGAATISDFMALVNGETLPDDCEYGWTKELASITAKCEQTCSIYIPFPELTRLEEPKVKVDSKGEE